MSHTIVVLEGDETGQELLEEALRVLDPSVTGVEVAFQRFDLGLENRRATRNQVVQDAVAEHQVEIAQPLPAFLEQVALLEAQVGVHVPRPRLLQERFAEIDGNHLGAAVRRDIGGGVAQPAAQFQHPRRTRGLGREPGIAAFGAQCGRSDWAEDLVVAPVVLQREAGHGTLGLARDHAVAQGVGLRPPAEAQRSVGEHQRRRHHNLPRRVPSNDIGIL